MRNKKRKGFTLVELVIVIAVIAILSAVLIPTFSNVIKNAKINKYAASIKNISSELIMQAMQDGVDYFDPTSLVVYMGMKGIDFGDIPSGYGVWYDQSTMNLRLLSDDEARAQGLSYLAANGMIRNPFILASAGIGMNKFIRNGSIPQRDDLEIPKEENVLAARPLYPEAITGDPDLLLIGSSNAELIRAIDAVYNRFDEGNTNDSQNKLFQNFSRSGFFSSDTEINNFLDQFDPRKVMYISYKGDADSGEAVIYCDTDKPLQVLASRNLPSQGLDTALTVHFTNGDDWPVGTKFEVQSGLVELPLNITDYSATFLDIFDTETRSLNVLVPSNAAPLSFVPENVNIISVNRGVEVANGVNVALGGISTLSSISSTAGSSGNISSIGSIGSTGGISGLGGNFVIDTNISSLGGSGTTTGGVIYEKDKLVPDSDYKCEYVRYYAMLPNGLIVDETTVATADVSAWWNKGTAATGERVVSKFLAPKLTLTLKDGHAFNNTDEVLTTKLTEKSYGQYRKMAMMMTYTTADGTVKGLTQDGSKYGAIGYASNANVNFTYADKSYNSLTYKSASDTGKYGGGKFVISLPSGAESLAQFNYYNSGDKSLTLDVTATLDYRTVSSWYTEELSMTGELIYKPLIDSSTKKQVQCVSEEFRTNATRNAKGFKYWEISVSDYKSVSDAHVTSECVFINEVVVSHITFTNNTTHEIVLVRYF